MCFLLKNGERNNLYLGWDSIGVFQSFDLYPFIESYKTNQQLYVRFIQGFYIFSFSPTKYSSKCFALYRKTIQSQNILIGVNERDDEKKRIRVAWSIWNRTDQWANSIICATSKDVRVVDQRINPQGVGGPFLSEFLYQCCQLFEFLRKTRRLDLLTFICMFSLERDIPILSDSVSIFFILAWSLFLELIFTLEHNVPEK